MRQTEALVKLVVEKLDQGVEAEFRKEQSSSVPDFLLRLPDGRTIPMEVTRATEPDVRSIYNALEKHGYTLETQMLQGHWFVMLASNACVKEVRKQAEKYLYQIEQHGIESFNYYLHSYEFDEVRRIYENLQIESGHIESSMSAGITLCPPSVGGKIISQYLIEAIEAECNKEDNRKKISPHGDMAVIIDSLKHQAWSSLERCNGTPDLEPDLPAEVRKLWVIATMHNTSHHVVWEYDKDGGWVDWGVLQIREEQVYDERKR